MNSATRKSKFHFICQVAHSDSDGKAFTDKLISSVSVRAEHKGIYKAFTADVRDSEGNIKYFDM